MGIDLALDLSGPERRGRPPRSIAAAVVRPLGEADLVIAPRTPSGKPFVLKKLQHRHHTLARALASGMKNWEAAAVSGYGIEMVRLLSRDPTFIELVETYRRQVDQQYADLHEKLVGLSVTAAEELQERLEDKPEDLSIGALTDLVKLGADRTGHGPASSSTNINVNVDVARRLEAGRRRVAERRLIDITPED